MNLKRKIQRKNNKEKRKRIEKDMSEKLNMFDEIPAECRACTKPFDKKNKEMVTSWNVVVREKDNIVRLYCPECWARAKNLVSNFFENREEDE